MRTFIKFPSALYIQVQQGVNFHRVPPWISFPFTDLFSVKLKFGFTLFFVFHFNIFNRDTQWKLFTCNSTVHCITMQCFNMQTLFDKRLASFFSIEFHSDFFFLFSKKNTSIYKKKIIFKKIIPCTGDTESIDVCG